MRRRLILITILAFLVGRTDAAQECNDEQQADASLSEVPGGSVHATACSQSDTAGTITIDVSRGDRQIARLTTEYESSAYVLALDTSVSFDSGATQGLGVSTGKGRDSTGMHYWKIPKTNEPIVDLGDAPNLSPDRFMRGTFSTLVTSSGRYQSIRYFYEVKHDHLVLAKAVGFEMKDSGNFVATLMNVLPGGELVDVRKRKIPVKTANQCMNGKLTCW